MPSLTPTLPAMKKSEDFQPSRVFPSKRLFAAGLDFSAGFGSSAVATERLSSIIARQHRIMEHFRREKLISPSIANPGRWLNREKDEDSGSAGTRESREQARSTTKPPEGGLEFTVARESALVNYFDTTVRAGVGSTKSTWLTLPPSTLTSRFSTRVAPSA